MATTASFRPWADVEAQARKDGRDEAYVAGLRDQYDRALGSAARGIEGAPVRGGAPKPAAPAPTATPAPATPTAPDAAAPPEAPGLVRRVAGRAYEDVAQGLRGVEKTTAPLGRAVSRGYRDLAGKALAEALARPHAVGLAQVPGLPKSTAKTLAGVPGSMAEFAGKRPVETAGFTLADILSGGTAAAEPAAAETVSLASRYALPLAKRVAKTAFAGLLAEPAERQLKTAAGEQPQASPEELTDIGVGGAKGYGLGELTYGTALRALTAAGRGLFGRRGPSVDALEAKPAIGTGGGSTPAEETPPTHLQQEPAAHTTRAVNEPAPIGRGAGSTPPAEPPLDQVGNAGGVGETAPPTASGASPATSSQPPGQASGRHPTTTPPPAPRPDANRPAAPAPAPRMEPAARPGPVGTFVAERQIRETAARQERARQAFAAASQPPRLALPPPMEPEPLPPPPMSVAAMNEAARVRAARRAARRGEFEMVPPDDPRVLAARAALRGEPAEPGQDTPTAQQQTARSAAQEALRAATGESEATSAQAPRRRRPPGPKAASPVAGAERGEEVPEAIGKPVAVGEHLRSSYRPNRAIEHTSAYSSDVTSTSGHFSVGPYDVMVDASPRSIDVGMERRGVFTGDPANLGAYQARTPQGAGSVSDMRAVGHFIADLQAQNPGKRIVTDASDARRARAYQRFGFDPAPTDKAPFRMVLNPGRFAETMGVASPPEPRAEPEALRVSSPQPEVANRAEPPPAGPRTIRDPSSDPIVEGFRQRLLKARDQVARYKTGTMRWNRAVQDKLRLQKALRAAEKNAGLDPMDVLVPDAPKPPRRPKSITLGSGFGPLGDLPGLAKLKEHWTRFRRKLPMEERILAERENSPVVGERHRWESRRADSLQDRVEQAFHHGVDAMDPEQFKDAEAIAHEHWVAHGRTPEAKAAAMRAFPPSFREWAKQREARFDVANEDRAFFGLDPIQRTEGPYAPRDVEERPHVVRIGGEGGGGAHAGRTSPGGHGQARVYDTFRAGERAGVRYMDPRNSMLLRDLYDIDIHETRNLFENLERKGVLFRDEAAAAQASPTGKPWRLENAPGGDWYTPTEAEARYLDHHLSRAAQGPWTSLAGYASAVFRNPNLFNPGPHIKNIVAMHWQARGGLVAPATLARDAVEWARGSNPTLLREFDEAMPASKTDRTVPEILGRELRRGPVADAVRTVLDATSAVGRPGRKVLFRWADPAARYSLFKYYRGQGLEPAAAANHAFIDLVDYGARSDVMDDWKSIPGNFFVPWRWGVVASVLKNVAYHPVRTALAIGAVDYLREVNRRHRGKWFPLPWDHIEGPIAQVVQSKDGVDLLKNATSQVALTRVFGPNGSLGAGELEALLKTVDQHGSAQDKGKLKNLFWGFSQLYNLPDEYAKGDYSGMFLTAFLGERDVLEHPPRQLWTQTLPEWLPGMQPSDKVQAAETIQAGKEEQAKAREIARPAITARKDALKNIEQAYIRGEAENDPERLEKAIEAAAEADEPITSDDIRRLLGSPTVQRSRAQAELETARDPETRQRLQDEIRDWTTDIGDRAGRSIPKGARAAVAALRAKAALDAAQGAR